MTGPAVFNLTRRQLAVLKLLAAGLQSKEIGRELGISPRTIEIHRRNLTWKMGGRNPAHLVAIAMRAGLIE